MMGKFKTTSGPWFTRACVILLLSLAYGGMSIFFRKSLQTTAYTHFAYIPILLAGIWWGRKSIYVALLLAGVTCSFPFFASGDKALWSDLARGMFFVIAAACVGVLSEKAMKSQQALRASEGKYRLLIDKSLSGIFVNRDYHIIFVNSRLSEMLGYEPKELLGNPVSDLIYERDRKMCCELIAPRPDRQIPEPLFIPDGGMHYECRFVRKDTKRIWVDLASSMTIFEGEPAVLVNAFDITDRKEAEEKRQELVELSSRQQEQLIHSTRLAGLGEMAVSIAHEINQPLTAVKNFAKNTCYMIETNAGGLNEIKANLQRITEQVDRASRIINLMRNLTRRTERQLTLLDLNGIIKESIEFIMPHFELHEVKVAVDLADNLPLVMGDKIRLEQVVLNILSNASQAMEDSTERRLTLKTYLEPGTVRPVVVEIADSGRGFTSEEAKKIFTPFFTTKRPGEGTGLGLSISLAIIKEHMGEIEATGAPGAGSVFKISLPLPRIEEVGRVKRE